MARARLLLAEVRRLAGQIGRIPENYPLHVVFVIRVISALLPWYTRPLTQFGQKVTESLDAIVDCLSLDVAGGGDEASRTTGRLPADSRSSMKTT